MMNQDEWNAYIANTPPMYRDDVRSLEGIIDRLKDAQEKVLAQEAKLDSAGNGPDYVLERLTNARTDRDHWNARAVERLRKAPGITPERMIEVMRFVRLSLKVE